MTLYHVTEDPPPRKVAKMDVNGKIKAWESKLNSIVSNSPPAEPEPRKANTLLEGCVIDEAKVQYYSQLMTSQEPWMSKNLKNQLDMKAAKTLKNAQMIAKKKEVALSHKEPLLVAQSIGKKKEEEVKHFMIKVKAHGTNTPIS